MNASTYEQRADMTYVDLFNPNVVLDRISPEAEYYDSKGGNTDIFWHLFYNYSIIFLSLFLDFNRIFLLY